MFQRCLDGFCGHAPHNGWLHRLSTQDSMRLYVDDKLLIDGWGKEKSADQALDSTLRPDALIKSALSLSTTGGVPA